jgi:pyruvate dehydrogenase E1 component beta subunit
MAPDRHGGGDVPALTPAIQRACGAVKERASSPQFEEDPTTRTPSDIYLSAEDLLGLYRRMLLIRGVIGGGYSSAAQHSDAMHPWFMNLGGIKVVLPALPADAKGLLKSAIRDDKLEIVLQAAGRAARRARCRRGTTRSDLGIAEVKRSGRNVTPVAPGARVRPATRPAKALAGEGIEAAVIDARTPMPLDAAAIVASAQHTGRLVEADEVLDACSAASHIAAVVTEAA